MIDAVVQGVVQGLTEFLPVSSSGHLVLTQQLFGFSELDPAYNVFVQGGTVISLLIYYFPLLRSLHLSREYIVKLAVATIPAAIAGILLEDSIDMIFGTTKGIAIGFLLTTIFLWLSKNARMSEETVSYKNAGWIGLAQAAAILPSLSRSGSTIGTALFLGIKPSVAFDFSFLMSIPVLIGSTLLSARKIEWIPSMVPSYTIGFVIAAVVGYISLIFLSRIIKQGKFYLFAPYTLALAVISLFI